jgi:hypothetical protein
MALSALAVRSPAPNPAHCVYTGQWAAQATAIVADRALAPVAFLRNPNIRSTRASGVDATLPRTCFLWRSSAARETWNCLAVDRRPSRVTAALISSCCGW